MQLFTRPTRRSEAGDSRFVARAEWCPHAQNAPLWGVAASDLYEGTVLLPTPLHRPAGCAESMRVSALGSMQKLVSLRNLRYAMVSGDAAQV